jgi:TraK protein
MFKTVILKQKGLFIFPMLVLTGLLGLSTAQAGVITVENNSTVTADISASDATRIAVAGDRITLIRGTENAYTISNDTTQGAVFIKPILPVSDASCQKIKISSGRKKIHKKSGKDHPKICPHSFKPPKPFYLFVSTEQAHNYVLQLTPKFHQAADLLTLKPSETEKAAALAWEKSDIYYQMLIRLLAALIHGQAPSGYIMTPLHQDFTFGSQINLHLAERWMGVQLTADVYRVVNHSRQVVTFTEQEFYQPGDRAIFLRKVTLAPTESTDLIKVRSDAHV